jgi:hypothetical protein
LPLQSSARGLLWHALDDGEPRNVRDVALVADADVAVRTKEPSGPANERIRVRIMRG